MKWLALVLALLVGAPGAFGQTTAQQVTPGFYLSPCPLVTTSLAGCFVPTSATAAPVVGFGNLTPAATTSTLISSVTLGPNSGSWPVVPGQVWISNLTTGILYVCPLGGTCGTSGLPILAGSSFGIFMGTTAMTVYAATSGLVGVQW